MELKEGMYIRYVPTLGKYTQKISKITKTKNCMLDMCYTLDDKEEVFSSHFDEIIKASHNIIDLIEVGDYVNGCYVSNKRASVNEHLGGHPKGIGIIKCNAYFNQGNYNDCKFEWIEEKDIKSIVTKEQFSQISYNLPKDK